MRKETQHLQKKHCNVAGLAAKQLCSLVYVCGFDPEQAKSIYIDPLLAMVDLDISVDYDNAHHKVTVSGLGATLATAEMRDGIGCTVTTSLDHDLPPLKEPLFEVQNYPLVHASSQRIANTFNGNAVEKALDNAFSPDHNTLAVVVLHKGELVAERYAPGISASTPLPGWSMAKSVTATLVGLMVKQGKLDINKPGIVPEWRNHKDGSERVALDHLLRMTSGLDVVEDQSGEDPNSEMLFVASDAAAFAANRGVKCPPGTIWAYMSGSTVLACRAVYQAAGGTLESSQRFYREAFMKPLGADSFVLETDASGTFIGSSYTIATPHDWAKFAQLYLDDGVRDGVQLLPEGWVEYVVRHTPESGNNSYGAGFWTVDHSNMDFLPKDTFYANGFQGQYAIVIPSRSLVIVRLGASVGPDGIWQLVDDISSAMR